jgi:hypothetical protein
MTKHFTRFGILASSVLGAILLLAVFAAGVAASSPVAPAPIPDNASAAIVASTPITLPSPSWRIGITADGLYRLTYETLDAAGVPVAGADPADLHLLWRGQEMALQEVGDGDGAFEPGEAFLFYAEKFHGTVMQEKYTDENSYWLTVDDSAAGLRVENRSVAPDGGGAPLEWYTASAHFEENYWHWSRHFIWPGTDATWFWAKLQAYQTTVTFPYTITLTAPAPETYTATLTVELAGRSDNVHNLNLSLNGTTLGDIYWIGKRGYTAVLPVPSTLIQEGVNSLDIAVVAGSSTQWVYLNWIEIDYRRQPVAQDDVLFLNTPDSNSTAMTLTNFSTATIHLYDITHPLTPTRLTGATAFLSGTAYALALSDTASARTGYLAVTEDAIADVPSPTIRHPADLVDPTEGADEIIIAPTEFITALQPLSGLRRSQGLRVHLVDVNDVYALFNGGIVDPEAIRGFVAHAYANWPGVPPAYLLLVGDGNLNPKGYYNPDAYGEFVPTLIPPYLEFADLTQGEVPVDSRFGDVDWDDMPEVMVGRIPAGSLAEVEGAVTKILAYESAPAAPWMMQGLMAADNYDVSAGDFKAIAEGLKQDYVPAQFDMHTVYLEDYGSEAEATHDITQTWSEGVTLLTYVGHAAVWRWAHEPMLVNTQTLGLTGTTGLPFVISLDCWDGYWAFPPKYAGGDLTGRDVRSMGEWATTVLTDRGAIATFGPAGLGASDEEEIMAQAMYWEIFENGTRRLGPITQAGREAISESRLARTYTLLGDPATELKILLHRSYIPLVMRDG